MTKPVHDGNDDRFNARVNALLTDAVARLDPADRDERIAYCRTHDQHGIRAHLNDDDDVIEFCWGGRTLAMVRRDVLEGDGPILAAEFIPETPNTIPNEWSDR